jgi:hypothetical protein
LSTDIDFAIKSVYIKNQNEARRPRWTSKKTRKLRPDLTDAQREQAERIGDLSFKSSRPVWDPASYKFIPSREQH